MRTFTALSPSRASDFKACPQLFKFRAIDRLPEPADPAQLRGSLVHLALEKLHRLPAAERSRARADQLLEKAFFELTHPEGEPPVNLADPVAGQIQGRAARLMDHYFRLEDPTEVHSLHLEWRVEHRRHSTLLLGVIDRVDLDGDGHWTLTDYKTGPSPSESYALGAFFGLRFYALVCWRAYGRLPKAMRLLHLPEPEVVSLEPTEQMLEALERQLEALGLAIGRAVRTGDWRPRPGRLCSWCPHQSICPAWAVKGAEPEAAAG